MQGGCGEDVGRIGGGRGGGSCNTGPRGSGSLSDTHQWCVARPEAFCLLGGIQVQGGSALGSVGGAAGSLVRPGPNVETWGPRPGLDGGGALTKVLF